MVTSILCALLLSAGQEEKPQPELKLPARTALLFALAKASQDGQSIAVTMPGGNGSGLQTYTVNVPVMQTVRDADGNEKRVTVMRQETRTRTVRTGRPLGMRTETYIVMVPEVRTRVKDGKEEQYTVQVAQQRTRQIPVYGSGSGKPTIYKLSKCTVTDLQGQNVSRAEVAKRLKSKSPILIVSPKQKLDPFYQAALNPNLLLVTPPAVKNAKPKPSRGFAPRP